MSVPGSPGGSGKEGAMLLLVDTAAGAGGTTVGLISGLTDDGTVRVIAAAPWRIVEAIAEAMVESGEPVLADVPDWAVLEAFEVDPK